MQKYLEIYNPTKTYVYPSMQVATPQDIQANYSMVNVDTCIVTTDKGHKMFYAIEFLDAMKDRLGVDDSLSDIEAVVALETILNEPQPIPEPSAEERIASAMEYQNLFL